MLVGGAAAAAVGHLQDITDDGLFVHRGTRRHRGRGRRGRWSSGRWLAPKQLLLASTLQVLQQVLKLTGLRSATAKYYYTKMTTL